MKLSGLLHVSSKALLRTAALVWFAAGLALMLRGTVFIYKELNYATIWMMLCLFSGWLFQKIAFDYLAIRHSRRMVGMGDKPAFFLAFFDLKSYFLMALMIGFGVFLASTGIVPTLLLHLFFPVMATPLLLTSLRFFRVSVHPESWPELLSTNPRQLPSARRFRILMRSILITSVISLVLIITSYQVIRLSSKPYTWESSELDSLPYNKAAIVLGTSQYAYAGRQNLYFVYRMQAAAELYKSGKVSYLILSGDNARLSYNEPINMKKALIKLGVPDSVIYLDYAGFRTLDSMVRSKHIFGQSKVTVVSQEFHNHRAIFLARRNGIHAIAYNARDVGNITGSKTMLREYLARVKVFIDLYLLDTQPRFLGKPVILGEKQIN